VLGVVAKPVQQTIDFSALEGGSADSADEGSSSPTNAGSPSLPSSSASSSDAKAEV